MAAVCSSFFAAPVHFHQIMTGKNLAHAAIFTLQVALVWIGTSLLDRPPSLRITLATAAGISFAVPIDFAAGTCSRSTIPPASKCMVLGGNGYRS